jgi:tRNA (guanine9-N1)-methyltransferase
LSRRLSWQRDECRARKEGSYRGVDKADGSRGRTGNDRSRWEVIYLSSDSPDTLTELKPYSTYIIGGLVDRNRHKGICYKEQWTERHQDSKATHRNYMQMTSRFVLATNHVSEIMLRWLELELGEAFLRLCQEKGGVLKAKSAGRPCR